MRVSTLLTLAIGATFLTAPALAQNGNVAMGYFVTVESRDVPAVEAAAKRHVEFHRRQNDSWRWDAWAAVTGPAGTYAYISDGHSWADFDNPGVAPAADGADWANTAGKFTVTEEAMMWEMLPWGSRPPAESGPAMVQVFDYQVKPGKAQDLEHVIRKFTEAATAQNWPGRYLWERTVSTGEPQAYFVVVPHESWASFEPLETSGLEVLIAAYGQAEAQRLLDMFYASAEPIGSRIWAYRADLSYSP